MMFHAFYVQCAVTIRFRVHAPVRPAAYFMPIGATARRVIVVFKILVNATLTDDRLLNAELMMQILRDQQAEPLVL